MTSAIPQLALAGVDFKHIGIIQPQRRPDGTIEQFIPQARYSNGQCLPLSRYGCGPFCKFKITNGLPVSGLYILTVDDEVHYVGECTNLSARFNAGYGNISPKKLLQGRSTHQLSIEQPDLHGGCRR